MESTPNQSADNNNSGKKAIAGFIEFDFPWIFSRIEKIMLNPVGCWDNIKSEALPVKELFGRYLIPLAFLSALSGFIGQSIIGISLPLGSYRIPLFSGLIFHAFTLLATLASFFISAFIIEKLSTKFETQVTREQALRLVGFAATPSLVAGILNLVPSGILAICALLLSIYGLYVLWSGFQTMTGVSDSKKIPYFISSLVCSFIAFLIVFGIVSSLFAPLSPEEMDLKEFQKNIEKLIPGAQ